MTIKQFTLFIAILSSISLFAQTPLPYFTGFDNAAQKEGWKEFRKGSTSNGGWDYATMSPFSSPNKIAHAFPVGGTVQTSDWFVSPPFNFSNGGKIDSLRHSFSGFSTPNENDTLAIYLLTGSPDPSLASSITLLLDYKTDYMSSGDWVLDSGISIPAKAGSSYLAFKYSTINNWFDVNFDNIHLSAKTNTFVKPVALSNSFRMFPNPATDYTQLVFPITTNSIKVYNHCGQLIYAEAIHQLTQTTLSLEAFHEGIYQVEVVSSEGMSYKKLVVLK